MSSGMENAQNFAAIISSMVLEPSFFDLFFMFSQFWVFLRPWLRPGPRPGAPWAPWGAHGPHGGFINPKGGGVGRGGLLLHGVY